MKKMYLVLLVCVISTLTVTAQTNNNGSISSKIMASFKSHVHLYFNDSVSAKYVKIISFENKSFDDLLHKKHLINGAVDYMGGRAVPTEDSEVKVSFQDDALIVYGIANGKGGFKTLSKLEFKEGVCVNLEKYGEYVYKNRIWIKK
jgi:hypothetical protein